MLVVVPFNYKYTYTYTYKFTYTLNYKFTYLSTYKSNYNGVSYRILRQNLKFSKIYSARIQSFCENSGKILATTPNHRSSISIEQNSHTIAIINV